MLYVDEHPHKRIGILPVYRMTASDSGLMARAIDAIGLPEDSDLDFYYLNEFQRQLAFEFGAEYVGKTRMDSFIGHNILAEHT